MAELNNKTNSNRVSKNFPEDGSGVTSREILLMALVSVSVLMTTDTLKHMLCCQAKHTLVHLYLVCTSYEVGIVCSL